MNELTIQELSNSDLIRSRIFTIRGVQVILDKDLAELYGEERFKLILDAMQDKKFPPQKVIKCCQCDNVANYQVQFPMLRAA